MRHVPSMCKGTGVSCRPVSSHIQQRQGLSLERQVALGFGVCKQELSPVGNREEFQGFKQGVNTVNFARHQDQPWTNRRKARDREIS